MYLERLLLILKKYLYSPGNLFANLQKKLKFVLVTSPAVAGQLLLGINIMSNDLKFQLLPRKSILLKSVKPLV